MPGNTYAARCAAKGGDLTNTNVLIVGAGPTGLALATELARFGIQHRLIDQSAQPAQWSQALVVQARTLEQFEKYGIAESAVDRGRKILSASIYSDHKHVLELGFDEIHSRYPFLLLLPQSETERLLTENLSAIGGRIERMVALESFAQKDNGVEAALRHADGRLELCHSDWLIGCDGAHSAVRQQSRIPFDGNSVDFEFFLGDLHLTGENVPNDEIRVYLHKGNVVFFGRLSESAYRVIVALHSEKQQTLDGASRVDADLTLADFQNAINDHADTGLEVSNPLWLTRFRISQRKAAHYRSRNIILCGDASHVHSPVAGQGMNTGIQDAANLGWKLAAVIGGAPPALIDSYDEERGAVGDSLLEATSRGLAAATTANVALEHVRDHVLRWMGGISCVQERARGFISETAIHYRHSSLVRDCGGGSPLHAGDRAPDAGYHDTGNREVRLHESLRSPQHRLLLLHVSERQRAALDGVWPEKQILALHPFPDEALAQVYGNKGEPVIYAIRPDGYIGFRGSLWDIHALAAYARDVGC